MWDSKMPRRLSGYMKARLPDMRLDEVYDPRGLQGRRWKITTLLKSVVAAHKHYLFRIKNERRVMFQNAQWLLDYKSKPFARTEDVLSNDKSVIRKLFIANIVERKERCFWKHTRTMLRVRSETLVKGVVTKCEDRYYASSLSPKGLSYKQWLSLVRNHWAVENNCHGTFDLFLQEDDFPIIQMEPVGALAVTILRRVAYNLLSLFRSVTQRSEDRKATPWRDLMRWFYNKVIGSRASDTRGLRPRRLAAAT